MSATLITQDIGLVRARAQGLRHSGAKLAHSLKTFSESSVVLIRGKESWRVAGAVLEEDWFARLECADARERAGRISSLLMRLVASETNDKKIFPIVKEFFNALTVVKSELHEAAEILAALRILSALGLYEREVSGRESSFAPEFLAEILKERTSYIARVNNGILASGL